MSATTLRDLLQEVVDKRLANRQLASSRVLSEMVEAEENRQPRGLQLNRTTVSQILSGTYKGVPSEGTIRAIGWLAGVSDDVAFTSAGRRPPGPPFALELPPGIDDLSPRERSAAIEILRALIAQRQEINRHEDAAASDSSTPSRAPGQARQDEEASGGRERDDDPLTASEFAAFGDEPEDGEHGADLGDGPGLRRGDGEQDTDPPTQVS